MTFIVLRVKCNDAVYERTARLPGGCSAYVNQANRTFRLSATSESHIIDLPQPVLPAM